VCVRIKMSGREAALSGCDKRAPFECSYDTLVGHRFSVCSKKLLCMNREEIFMGGFPLLKEKSWPDIS
jgi:hypothetical protein